MQGLATTLWSLWRNRGNERRSYLSSTFYTFRSLTGTLVTRSGLLHVFCADALWYYKCLRTTHANGVFLKVQTLLLDCLHARRCWRGRSAVLMILAWPDIGLFILGCLPKNRLVAVKAIYHILWLDVFLLFFWYNNTVRMTPELCFFLLLIERFHDWKQSLCCKSSGCSKASEVEFSTEVTRVGLNYLF